MSGFIEGEHRGQSTLFPERFDDYVGEESPVRVIDVFIDGLDIPGLGFKTEASDTGRPGYHPRTMLKIYVYGCLITRDGMLHMMFKLGQCAEQNWRRLRGFDYLAKVIAGAKFEDGIEVTQFDQVAA